MKNFSILVISIIVLAGVQSAYAQNPDRGLDVTDEEKIIVFSGFIIAVLAVFLFLARDVILRKKTSYDKKELESKKDKTFEKYHSDWGEDYEELGQRKNTKKDKELRDALKNDELPDYYEIMGIAKDATHEEIKKRFRELAKKKHPDKTGENSEEEMAELNKAYEILSDKEQRGRYDRYFKAG